MLETLKMKVKTLFVPATLEYLKKGGRIGGAQALIGTILQIKPILTFREGKIEVFEKVRTMRKALERTISELPERPDNVQVAILQAEAEETAALLRGLIEERLPGVMPVTYELSPVIGTHVGPGTVGLVSLQL
jgi:DegV family protein with EDD domain